MRNFEFVIEKNEADKINEILSMLGSEIQEKYGYFPSTDVIGYEAHFVDNIMVKIEIIMLGEEFHPIVEGSFFVNNICVDKLDAQDDLFGEWHFRYNNETYIVYVKEE